MRTVRIQKEEFIAKVEANRADHRRVFEEAVDGYRDRVISELERRLTAVKRGRAFNQYFKLPEPEAHTEDYDRVLEMARMSIDDVVELTDDDFRMFVLDQWAWKRSFAETTSSNRSRR